MVNAFGKRSLERLEQVHPDLVRVCHGAIRISEVDFAVIEGVRTVERQIELYAKGRTTAQMRAAGIYDVEGKPGEGVVTRTLNSEHFIRPATGFGHAVDLAPFIAGKINWDENNWRKWKYFPLIAKAMKIAAKEADVPLEWGGDWVTLRDGPHFQLPKGHMA